MKEDPATNMKYVLALINGFTKWVDAIPLETGWRI